MKCEYCNTANVGDGRGRCVNCGAPYVSVRDTAPLIVCTPTGEFKGIDIDFSNPSNPMVLPADATITTSLI